MNFQGKIVHILPEIYIIFFRIIELETSSILGSKIAIVGRCLLEFTIGARKKEQLALGDVWKHWRSVGEELFMQIFMAGFLLASGFSFIIYFFVREKIKYLEKIIKYHEDRKSEEL